MSRVPYHEVRGKAIAFGYMEEGVKTQLFMLPHETISPVQINAHRQRINQEYCQEAASMNAALDKLDLKVKDPKKERAKEMTRAAVARGVAWEKVKPPKSVLREEYEEYDNDDGDEFFDDEEDGNEEQMDEELRKRTPIERLIWPGMIRAGGSRKMGDAILKKLGQMRRSGHPGAEDYAARVYRGIGTLDNRKPGTPFGVQVSKHGGTVSGTRTGVYKEEFVSPVPRPRNK